jgi:hypothetical protein
MARKFSLAGTGSSGRAVRLAWLAFAVAIMALIGAWAAVKVAAMMQAGHPLRGAALAIGTLLLMLLGLLVAAAQWRGISRSGEPPILPSDGSDQTGIWGVGGPSMREPGSTGSWPARRVDRRYGNSQD